MPTSIPIQIAEHQFSSMNKARIYFTDILHLYPEGGVLTDEHKQEVFGLMEASHSRYPTADSNIAVTRGFFGRSCFAAVGPDKQPKYISIIQSLKKCAVNRPGNRGGCLV